MAFLLFGFGIYNIHRYLIKQRKFAITVILFYVAAFLSIVFIFLYCLVVGHADTCKVLEAMSVYGAAYANLIMGACQASMLTILAIQLHHLFKYSRQLLKHDYCEFDPLEEQ